MNDRRDGSPAGAAEPVFGELGRGTREGRIEMEASASLRTEARLRDVRVRRGGGSDLEGTFRARAEALGMGVRSTSRRALRRVLEELVARHGPAVVEPRLLEAYPELGGLGDCAPDDPGLFAASCGVTGVEYAIAETGSLVVASELESRRRFSLVPPVHVPIVERWRLVPDLLDVLLAHGGRGLPAHLAVITGPGRTVHRHESRLQGAHASRTVECIIVS